MAGLIGLEPCGVRVDFPDEPTTGGDMEWIYAAPFDINGGRYLRLILQAKRAQSGRLKNGNYWYYRHLDHGSGRQAQALIRYSTGLPGTLPLYMFYHPRSALAPAAGSKPAIEGINVVFADKVAVIVNGGCDREKKKVDYWRADFLRLSDLLCWPTDVKGPTPGFHPDFVAQRFQTRHERLSIPVDVTMPRIEPASEIPNDIMRAITGNVSTEDRKLLKHPRAILWTRLTKKEVDYSLAE
jgi:hypothetical protein